MRSVTLTSDDPAFGGLSAIETRDGSTFVVLSDRGQAYEIAIDRTTSKPRITPRTQPAPQRDSEGLAYAGSNLFFSYEGPAEIRTETGERLPTYPAFRQLQSNGSFEALAAAPDGTVYVIPERFGERAPAFPVYRYRDGAWSIARGLPKDGSFLPAGADIGPDGLLYVLERTLTPLGFRSRVRRFAPDTDGTVETLLTTPPGRHDNLEGLAIWQSATGQTCLTMVSDNNFLRVQRTEIVEYSLIDPLAAQGTCD
ncbi:esterase-like activity of phytase family protein [Tateyamaria sp. SN6-1]|uniref:esterase-like activity of phytase family protein n=1 Tax=Tateyamaria sp. SN6-1 TaxID=3092148 RepID=UPI0039F570DC